ncbi:hypothetical protein Goshw_005968 [Gossypium schwendimanii]|uniref:Uncharacterized protein n=1 Tax=Gossypium schwendimanii TaxID=34291 RepID=A0A7J9LTQ7_GOSSC|nr:hypothetical protein [Gossypium schwendimanii]
MKIIKTIVERHYSTTPENK